MQVTSMRRELLLLGLTACPGGPEPVGEFGPTYELFEGTCVVCHGTLQLGELDLSTADLAYDQLVGVGSVTEECGPPHIRVIAGDPDGSLLYQKLADTMICGEAMPSHEGDGPGPPPFDDRELAVVREWIAAGALR